MARIRTIKPEFFTSAQIAECSTSARLLFVGLWCFSDDGGIHPANVKQLSMEVFPGDKLPESKVAAMVDELLRTGLIVEFSAEGRSWWAVTGWKHQRIDRPSYKYPQPDSAIIRRMLDDDSTTPRSLKEGKGRECKGREGKRREEGGGAAKPTKRLAATDGYTPDFEAFWAAFPAARRKNKPDAFAAWKAALLVADAATLTARASDYAASWEGRSQFVRGPTPWLNQQAWNDPAEAWRQRKQASKADELAERNRAGLMDWLHQTGELSDGDPRRTGPDDRAVLPDLRQAADASGGAG